MRNMIAALVVGVVGAGFAVSAQAAPSSPLTTLSQSSIEHVQYGHCKRVYVCHGHGYHKKCRWVRRCH